MVQEGDGERWGAMICQVHGDRAVNVVAFQPLGSLFPFLNIKLLQPGDSLPLKGVAFAEFSNKEELVGKVQKDFERTVQEIRQQDKWQD